MHGQISQEAPKSSALSSLPLYEDTVKMVLEQAWCKPWYSSRSQSLNINIALLGSVCFKEKHPYVSDTSEYFSVHKNKCWTQYKTLAYLYSATNSVQFCCHVLILPLFVRYCPPEERNISSCQLQKLGFSKGFFCFMIIEVKIVIKYIFSFSKGLACFTALSFHT